MQPGLRQKIQLEGFAEALEGLQKGISTTTKAIRL